MVNFYSVRLNYFKINKNYKNLAKHLNESLKDDVAGSVLENPKKAKQIVF